MKRYRAKWIYSGDAPPLENATVEIENGLIDRVSSEHSDALDLGDVALIPGLINAHTHLEFSSIVEPLEPLHDFTNWIPSVVSWRRQNPDSLPAAIQMGLQESIQSGVTTIAEIATSDWTDQSESLSSSSEFLMFHEYLGLSDEAAESQLQNARSFLQKHLQLSRCVGLSPHAPYSLNPVLFEGLCDLAAANHVPLAMHLGESPEEMEYMEHGTGAIAQMYERLGVSPPGSLRNYRHLRDYLERLDCGVHALVVHGNYLQQREIDFLKSRSHMSVVYCPRTHAAMQTNEHPWLQLDAAGINVALGTDSRASNPDLSIWNELRFLHLKNPDLASSQLLKFATVNAAKALNLDSIGKVELGRRADFCIFPVDGDDPERNLFSRRHPTGVMKKGEWVLTPEGIHD